MRRSSLSSPSQVACQSSPSTQVTPVTKRLDSIVRRTAPVCGSTWWILRSRYSPHPEASLGPGQARVAAVAGRGNGGDHRAGRRVDLLDAVLGDLEQVPAVERRAGVRGHVDRAQRLAARRIQGVQLVAGGEPDVPAVVGDAVTFRPRERGRTHARSALLVASWRHPNHPAAKRGVTKTVVKPGADSAAIQRRARPWPTHSPCPPPPAIPAHAARCAGWPPAPAPAPNSTTIRRRPARPAPPHAPRPWAAPARPPPRRRADRARNPRCRCDDAGQRFQQRAQPSHLDPQPRAVRLVRPLAAEGPRDQRVARHVGRPRFAQRPGQREEHGPARQRHRRSGPAHGVTARVHHEGARTRGALPPRPAAGPAPRRAREARGGRSQGERCALHFRGQGGDAGVARGAARPRRAQRAPPAVRRRRTARPATTSAWAAFEAGGKGVGSSPASIRSASPSCPTSRRRRAWRCPACAALARSPCASERRPGGVQRLGGPAQVARDERDLGLGDNAACAGHGLPRPEGARGAAQQGLGADQVAEPRHRDAAQRERRRVVAQGDALQGAEHIAGRQRARGGRGSASPFNPAPRVSLAPPVSPCLG